MSEATEMCPQCGLPVTAPRNPPMSMEAGVCPACGQAPLEVDMRNVYGSDTNRDELRTKLKRYLSEVTRFDTRREQGGQSPSFQEAVDLVNLYPWPNPENSTAWATFGLVLDCVEEEDGREVLVEEHVQKWLEVWQDEDVGSWDRFWVQEALEESAKRVLDHPLATEIFQRLANGRLNRPRGRCDPRTDEVRNTSIVTVIGHLQSLGMKPTRNDASPPYSACDAVAAVVGLKYDRVKGIWKQSRGRT